MNRVSRCHVPAALVCLAAVLSMSSPLDGSRLAEAAPAAGQQPSVPPQNVQQPERQAPPVTFRVEINYVEVDAVVADRQGNFVSDLTKDDFEVLEDGKPQKLSAFSLVNIPVETEEKPLFATRPIEPDVRTNTQGLDGRIYLLVLDDLHTAPQRSMRVRAAVRQFIEQRMGANDVAAVVATSGSMDAAQDFTNNRRLLLDAVNRFMGRKLRSPTLEKLEQYSLQQGLRQMGDPISDPVEAERAHNARLAFDDIKRMSDFMAGVRGRRKALILFSEGVDYNIYDVINSAYASDLHESARQAIAAATRANVNIYAVDPRGLTNMGDEAIEIQGLPDDATLNLGPQSMLAELRLSQDSLRELSDETGGFAAVNANDFRGVFERIVRENSSYYLLGYYPQNDRRDGKFRKLEVKVKRPGVEVRFRRGYVAPAGKSTIRQALDSDAVKSAEMREALESPLPMSGLTLAVSAASFKGTAPNASVVVIVQAAGRDLAFVEKAGRFDENIEVSALAVDRDGKVRAGDRQVLNMTLSPETRGVVQRVGFRMVFRLNLQPGRYQIRVAGRDAQGGKVGSVYYDLAVPDFSKAPLSMSGLVLTSRRAGLVPTPQPDAELKKALPAPPTTAREFLSDDELAVLAEVYDTQAAQAHQVNIATTVSADGGRTVFQHADQRSSTELTGKSGGYGYSVRIPLSGLAPGLYVLKVEARSTLGRTEPVSREVQFRVRER